MRPNNEPLSIVALGLTVVVMSLAAMAFIVASKIAVLEGPLAAWAFVALLGLIMTAMGLYFEDSP